MASRSFWKLFLQYGKSSEGAEQADPFNSTAIWVDSNAFHLLHIYLVFAHYPDATACNSKNEFPRDPASTGSAAMVSVALSNELHRFSPLSYITTSGIEDERQLASIGHARSSYYVHKALVGVQDKLRSRSKGDTDLLYDAALLGETATHRNELEAAIAQRQATKFHVDALGGFRALPPRLVGPALGPDFYVSVSTLSRPVFKYGPSTPPLPWTGSSALNNIGMAVQNTASVNGLDKCIRKLLQDLIQVGQVLECVVSQPESSMNAFWVPWKCATMILALLSSATKQGDSKPDDKGRAGS